MSDEFAEDRIRKQDKARSEKWKQDQGPITTERHCRVTDGERVGYRCVGWSNGIVSLYGPVYTDTDESEVIE